MKKVVYGVFGLLIVLSLFFLVRTSPSITSATFAAQTKCVQPGEAISLVNERACERIYEDERCQAKGLVELRCP